jgi:hypothetical protein
MGLIFFAITGPTHLNLDTELEAVHGPSSLGTGQSLGDCYFAVSKVFLNSLA